VQTSVNEEAWSTQEATKSKAQSKRPKGSAKRHLKGAKRCNTHFVRLEEEVEQAAAERDVEQAAGFAKGGTGGRGEEGVGTSRLDMD